MTRPDASPGKHRPLLTALLVLTAAAAILWIVAGPATVADAGAAPMDHGSSKTATDSGPVVIELFTSQGCSSCPPADRLLTRLGQDPALSTKVFPLAYHVDYWNYIGWTDPFSSKRWSNRQNRYAQAFNSNRVYTPQLVVDGRWDCVGSQEAKVDQLIHRALAQPQIGHVDLRLAPGKNPNDLRAISEAQLTAAAPRALDLWIALYQKDLTTSVARGENANRKLRNDYVVRQLRKAYSVAPAAGSTGSGEVSLTLEPDWNRSDLGVVAFLQDPETQAIHGAARATLEVMQ